MVPIIKQYLNIKKKYPDILVFYQIGDFYELFYDDAKKISSLLNLTLTEKIFVKQNNVPMAGIPVKFVDNYIYKLICLGESVVLCNQILEFDNIKNKNLIKRKVIRIITPGTVSEEKYLNNFKDNYIAAIYCNNNENIFGYSYLDVSSGRFYVSEIYGLENLKQQLLCTEPSEILCCKKFIFLNKFKFLNCFKYVSLNKFNFNKNYDILLKHFNVVDFNCFGIKNDSLSINSAGCILRYVKSTQFVNLNHINKLKLVSSSKKIFMDFFTIKNLELINSFSGNNRNTLLYVLDNVCTPMGKRMLKRWILFPTRNINELHYRHNIMDLLKTKFDKIKLIFKGIGDLERILGRISLKTVSSKDLINLKNYLVLIIDFLFLFKVKSDFKIIVFFLSNLSLIKSIINLINNSISDPNLDNKNIIIHGYSKKLDYLRELFLLNKKKIFFLEEKERKKTGIKSLCILNNKINGYYIQINKCYSHLVPNYYIKYKILKYSDKYIIPDLKLYENNLFILKKKIKLLEKNIFNEIINFILKYINNLNKVSHYVAKLDVLLNFVDISYKYNYKKPIFTSKNILKIYNSRHPVIERIKNNFIPNNLYFSNKKKFLIITGPNMGGKSTYMRQIALICIIAYIGCYVPAESLIIGPVDKILTRIGFSDDISSNKSTFLVEMSDIANIINNSTTNSLVLIDEMCRGTSYNEGLSLAWSCLYYIIKFIKPMLLFSTHFFELTNIANILKNIRNIYFDYIIHNNNLVLLYKIKSGVCYRSFGFNILHKVGIPKSILDFSFIKFKKMISNYLDKNFLIENNFCFNKKHSIIFDIIININLNDLSLDKLLKKIKKLQFMCSKI